MMNRTERRRADRALRKAMRRGRAEMTGVLASCGWDCGRPGSVVRATSMEDASVQLHAHYDAEHDGREP